MGGTDRQLAIANARRWTSPYGTRGDEVASRKLDKPLAVVIQSSSAAGKSSLVDAILRFVPNEEQVGYSAMTGQSLFYMGGMELKNKILSIAEEEGVAQASYALKLLPSEGQQCSQHVTCNLFCYRMYL